MREFVPKIHLPPLLKSISLISERFLDFGVKRRVKPRREYTQHYKITVGGFPSAYKVLGLMDNRVYSVPQRLLSFSEIGHTVKIAVKEKG